MQTIQPHSFKANCGQFRRTNTQINVHIQTPQIDYRNNPFQPYILCWPNLQFCIVLPHREEPADRLYLNHAQSRKSSKSSAKNILKSGEPIALHCFIMSENFFGLGNCTSWKILCGNTSASSITLLSLTINAPQDMCVRQCATGLYANRHYFVL